MKHKCIKTFLLFPDYPICYCMSDTSVVEKFCPIMFCEIVKIIVRMNVRLAPFFTRCAGSLGPRSRVLVAVAAAFSSNLLLHSAGWVCPVTRG